MGFGTLFIGYFLLLNVTYFAWTDLIAALVMALGLYKLSGVNRYFKYALFSSLAHAVVGAVEFALEIVAMLLPYSSIEVGFMSILRCAVLCALTVSMLLGIYDVAREVDLPALSIRAKRMVIPAVVIYVTNILLDTPTLFTGIEPIYVALIFTILLIALFFLIIYNLITVYTAYMKICMPSDNAKNANKTKTRL